MAFTQTVQNATTTHPVITKDADGYKYTVRGGIREYIGTGSPNGVITAPKGSLCIELDGPAIYQNTDAGTTWVACAT